ncbi:MAG: glycoside hydrolase family 113 [Phycisphaeraceae bacterium]
MLVRIVIILVLLIYVLSVVAVLTIPAPADTRSRVDGEPRNEPAAEMPRRAETLPQLVGITLNLYHTDDVQRHVNAVDRIAALGFNTLHAVSPVFQRDGAANEIERIVGEPGRALQRDQIVRVLGHAKERGLRVTLMPQINFTAPRGNEWRGKIQPDRWRDWWTSYKRMMHAQLDIAKEAEVDLFIIGCELLSTQKPTHEARWREIVALARENFDGPLSYSTNWDSYQTVPFWDELDAIGISGYWDLTRNADDAAAPTAEELRARWEEIRKTVLTYADRQKRPILLTEIGYPSLPWALRDPWNYVNPDGLTADHEAQARGYRSFLDAWSELIRPPRSAAAREGVTVNTPQVRWRLPDARVAGVLFYGWDIDHAGGARDTGYGIAGKPAHDLLRRWLAGEALR